MNGETFDSPNRRFQLFSQVSKVRRVAYVIQAGAQGVRHDFGLLPSGLKLFLRIGKVLVLLALFNFMHQEDTPLRLKVWKVCQRSNGWRQLLFLTGEALSDRPNNNHPETSLCKHKPDVVNP